MKTVKQFAAFLLFFVFLQSNFVCKAATRTASVSGNWNNTATWGGSSVPGSADDVRINAGITVTVNIAAVCKTLTYIAVTTNSNVTISGVNSLTISGLLSMPRPSNNRTCIMNLNAGTLSCGSLTLNATTSGRNNIINITTGTFTISGDITTGTTGCQIIFTGAGTLNMAGSLNGSPTITTITGSTVNYTGSDSQTIYAIDYNGNLGISGAGTKTIPASIIVHGTLNLSNGLLINGNYLTMANGSTISRSQGFLWAAPLLAGTVNLLYTGGSPITTGYEVPSDAVALNNLTTNTGGVIQGGTPNAAVNILTDGFNDLTNWTGNIGATNNQFSAVTSTNAGGTSKECRYYYGSSSLTNTAFIYRSVNTTGYTSLNISWKQFLNNYDPVTYPYTIKVQCATSSSGPWTDIYSLSPSTAANIGPETKVYYNWTTNVGGTFYIRYYITGITYGIDYWYFDDLIIEAPSTIPPVPSTITVNGTLDLSNGYYSIGSNNLTLNGYVSGSNLIIGSTSSNLSIGGSSLNVTLPAITNGLNNFTINRSNSVTLNGNVSVNNTLYLSNGTVDNGSYLTMANGTTISRSQGVLSSVPTFAGTVNLLYTGSSPITTGHEVPDSAHVINNLTTNTGGVVQNGIHGMPVNLLTDAFDNLTGWTGNTGSSFNQFNSTASSNAGGMANECSYLHGFSSATIYSASIYRLVNTTGYNSIDISWKQFLNNNNAVTYPYTLKVQCATTSSGPWTDIYSLTPQNNADVGPGTLTYHDWTTNVGGDFYIRYYITGYTAGLDNWHIDDLVINSQTIIAPSIVTVNGTLNLTNGTYSISSNTLVLNGSISGSNTLIGSSESNLSVGGSGSNLGLSTITNGLDNFTINRSNGVTLNGDLTVNGILNLQSTNPNSSQGSLHMGTNILTMAESATTIGAGEVTGIIKRTSFIANTLYTFGNQFTSATLSAGGTFPSEIQVKVKIGTAPTWKTDAIFREYDIKQTGGVNCNAIIATHYLDSELNGNDENMLVRWRYIIPLTTLEERGRSNYNTTENWVATVGIPIDLVPSTFGLLGITLANSQVSYYRWDGSESTSWTNQENWTPAASPSNISNIIIPDSSTTLHDPILPGTTEIKTLNIEPGGVLNTVANEQLTINGDNGAWDNIGGSFNPGTSSVIFTNAAASMAGITNFYNVTIASAAALTPGTDNIMRIAGSLTLLGSGILRGALLNNTIEYNGAAQVVINPNGITTGYHNLILSGSGIKTMPTTGLSILNDFTIAGSASATAAETLIINGDITIGSGTTINLSSYSHTFSGNLTNNGGIFTPSTSSVTFNGTEMQTITSAADITFNNLTIANNNADVILGISTNCSVLGNLTVDTSSVFDLTDNILTEVTGSVTNSGTIKTQNTSSTPYPADKTWGGLFEFTGSTAQTIMAGTYNNLSLIGSGGATSANNITVNGILNLESANPSSSKGILDLGVNTLLMGASATTVGQGDVTGIVKRTTILPDIAYTFGNELTIILFQNVGILPTEISLKITIGTAPIWKPEAIKRIYDLIQTGGGGGTQTLIYSHYLDSELNGNPENTLVNWVWLNPATTIEYGRSFADANDNWVAISDVDIGFFTSSFGDIEVTLGESQTLALTWNGSVDASWVDANNWTPQAAPSDVTAITIPDAGTTDFDPSIPAIASCGTINLESGAILNSVNGAVLTITGGTGAWNNQGGIFNAGNSSIVFIDSSATMSGSTDFYNITIDTTSILTLESNTYMGISGSIINNGILQTVNRGSTTVEYKGGNQTVIIPNPSLFRYSTLILSGNGTKTFPATALNIVEDFIMAETAIATAAAPMTFAGNVTIGANCSFITGNHNHSIHENLVNNGIFTANAGNTITMNGTTTQEIGGTNAISFYNLTINNNQGISLSTDININNVLALTDGNLSVGAIILGINGSISKTAGYIDVNTLSSLSFGGTDPITIANDLFTASPSILNFTLNNAGGVTLGNQDMSITGLLDLDLGTLTIGANTLNITGSSPTRTSGSIDASNANATLTFSNTSAITLPNSIFESDVTNLTINDVDGVTSVSDFTLNGVLNLQSANPSANKGILDMWDGSVIKTLTMGENATTIGTGDVTGIIKRTSFVANTPYTFGNQFATATISSGGTLPTQIELKISIGTPPAWKSNAINRIFEYIQTGGSDCFVTLASHYLDTELNGNDESKLVVWGYGNPGPLPGLNELGRSSLNSTDNWVAIANIDIGYFPTSFGEFENTLANTELVSYTWTGSQSTSWLDTDNWDPVGTPSSVSNIIIPDAVTTLYDPTLPDTTEIKSLTIEASGILNAVANEQLTINGDNGAWINEGGTFNSGTSKVIFTNDAATISGTTNFYDVTIETGKTLLMTSGCTMGIAGIMTNNGTWNTTAETPTTVVYNGTSSQTLEFAGATTFYNLTIDNVTGVTLNSDYLTTVTGDLVINSGRKLVLASGKYLTVDGTLTNNADFSGLIIESTSTGTASLIHNSGGVRATIQRYFNLDSWHIISSSVAGQDIPEFLSDVSNAIPVNGPNFGMMYYSESAGGWRYITTSTTGELLVGIGYLLRHTTNSAVSEYGTLNYASTDIDLTRNGNGWNSIGNPFTCSIGVRDDATTTENFLTYNSSVFDPSFAAIYVWDEPAVKIPGYSYYKVISNSGFSSSKPVLDQSYLQPGQGFLVKSKINGGKMRFTSSMRIHENTASNFKAPKLSWPGINLIVSSVNKTASTAITFNKKMTRGLDITYDAGDMGGDASFKLYSRLVEDNGVNFMIQCLPENNYDTLSIPLGFNYNIGGVVTFNAENILMPVGCKVILEDRLLGIFTDLKVDSSSYSVNIVPNTFGIGRFYLHTFIENEAPSVPTGLTATDITVNSFTLSWSASTDNIGVTGYEVFKNDISIGTTSDLSYSITGLLTATTYAMTVKAYDDAANWSAASTSLDITTLDTIAPSVPIELASSYITGNSFTLSWSESIDNVEVTGYEVYKNGTSLGITSGLSYCITGLTSATTYEMTVKARDDAANWSAASSIFDVTTLDTIAPSIPVDLIATDIMENKFTLGWSASSDNAGVTGYEIYSGAEKVGTTSDLAITISELTCETIHSMTVRARDDASNWSEASVALPVTTSICSDSSTNVLTNSVNTILVYPNPTESKLLFKNVPVNANIKTFNVVGQKVSDIKAVGSNVVFDVSEWDKGIYLFRIEYNESIVVKRVMVK